MTYSNGSASSAGRHDQARQAAPLRIIRMPASKPWRRPERPPALVFRVDQAGFRELVHKLTGAPPPRPITRPVTESGFAAEPPPINVAENTYSDTTETCACRLQKYVGKGSGFGEDRRRVWASPAGPADGDWIDRIAAPCTTRSIS